MNFVRLRLHSIFLIVAAISIWAASHEAASAADEAVVTHFFLNANLKAKPVRLEHEIKSSEAARRAHYYVAVLTNNGNISVFCTVRHGHVDSRTEYKYEESGTLLRETSFNNDGSGYSLTFNKSGDIISHEQWPEGKTKHKLICRNNVDSRDTP